MLKTVVEKENPNVVIAGKQAIDDDSNQVGQLLAAMLGWSQATNASKIQLGETETEVVREIDGGLETVKVKMPAVITVDLRLNEPRYASLPNIMKAKKKPIDVMTPDDLEVDITPRLKTLKVTEPPSRDGGEILENIDALIEKLKNEAKVI